MFIAGNIAGRSLVGTIPIERGSMVSAARIFTSLQRRRVDRSDALASSASAFGIASANYHGKAQPSGGRCQTFARHLAEIQGGHGRSCGIRLYEGHRSLPPRLAKTLAFDLSHFVQRLRSLFLILLFNFFLSIFNCKLYPLSVVSYSKFNLISKSAIANISN